MQLNKKDKYYLITIFVLAFIFFFFKLWGFMLFDVDEPRYAEAAREMIESNNWITPYFNYVVRFDKPVLFYWLIAFCYKLFGVSEFAARLPSAIMATLMVLSTYFFGRKHINQNFAFISALVLLTSLQFIGLARMSITDMTLSGFICFMLFSGFTAIHSAGNKRILWWYAFYIFLALGTLSKGPVAPAVAVIVIWPYCLLTGRFIEVFKTCRLYTGILLFLIITAPWYILVYLENGQAYIDQFIITDNLKRFTGTVSGHKGPVYFFFIVVLVGFIPWSTFLPYALIKYLKPVFDSFKKKQVPLQCSIEGNEENKECSACIFVNLFKKIINPIRDTYNNVPVEKGLILFALIWFLSVFTFFSLSGTKLLTYILPLFPALALIMGMLWYDFIENKDKIKDKYMLISSGFLVTMFLIIAYLLIFQFNALMPRDAKVLNLGDIRIYGALTLSLGSILCFIFIILKKRAFAFYSLVAMIVCIAFIAIYGILPGVNNAAQGHLNKLINVANNYPGGKYTISTYGLVKPSIVFYSQRAIEHIEPHEPELLNEKLNNENRIFIITRVRFLDELSKNSNVYIIDIGRRFALFTNKPFDKKVTKKLLKGKH